MIAKIWAAKFAFLAISLAAVGGMWTFDRSDSRAYVCLAVAFATLAVTMWIGDPESFANSLEDRNKYREKCGSRHVFVDGVCRACNGRIDLSKASHQRSLKRQGFKIVKYSYQYTKELPISHVGCTNCPKCQGGEDWDPTETVRIAHVSVRAMKDGQEVFVEEYDRRV